MPRDKRETYEKIIPAAREEFLKNGFEQASMRAIAARVGISAAGLYRHFKDKEELFAALAEPGLQALMAWYEQHKAMDYELLDENRLEAMWEEGGTLDMVMQVIYPNFDIFKLLICCSEGTRYGNFVHEMVMLEQRETEAFLRAVRERGLPVKEVRPGELHLLLSAYVTALFEIVVHDFPREEEHYLQTFREFFIPAGGTCWDFRERPFLAGDRLRDSGFRAGDLLQSSKKELLLFD